MSPSTLARNRYLYSGDPAFAGGNRLGRSRVDEPWSRRLSAGLSAAPDPPPLHPSSTSFDLSHATQELPVDCYPLQRRSPQSTPHFRCSSVPLLPSAVLLSHGGLCVGVARGQPQRPRAGDSATARTRDSEGPQGALLPQMSAPAPLSTIAHLTSPQHLIHLPRSAHSPLPCSPLPFPFLRSAPALPFAAVLHHRTRSERSYRPHPLTGPPSSPLSAADGGLPLLPSPSPLSQVRVAWC